MLTTYYYHYQIHLGCLFFVCKSGLINKSGTEKFSKLSKSKLNSGSCSQMMSSRKWLIETLI